jgi:hypothetical protein
VGAGRRERISEKRVSCEGFAKPVEVSATADEFVEQKTEDDSY